MENELTELFKGAKRAADGAENSPGEEERCLDALEQLKKFPVNYQILVSTQVGKRLRQLTKHRSEKIKALASDVVDKWKSIIVKETMKNKNDTVEKGDSVKAGPAAAETNKVKNIQRSNSVKVEQNSAKKLKVEEGMKSEVSSSIKIEKAEFDATENNKLKNIQRSNSVKFEHNAAAKKLKVEDIKSEVKIEKAEFDATENSKLKNIQRSNSAKFEQNTAAKKVKVEDIKSEVKLEKVEFDATEDNKLKNIQRSNSVKVEPNTASKKLKVEDIKSEVKIEKSEVVQTTKNATGKHVKVETKVKVEKSSSKVQNPASDPMGPPKLTSMVYCKDPVRDKLREIIAEALCNVSKEVNDDGDLKERVDDCDPYRVAVIVETTLFEKWGKSNGAQKFKYRSVIFNIKDPKNPDFRRKVLLGDIEPRAIPELTPEQMASEERQAENKELKAKALFNSLGRGPPKASTDQFTCGRCKKKETTYHQMQTRSADEPMTTFVTCTNCGNNWKFC